MMQQKGANQLWRESGTTLSFKDWIEREKSKSQYANATGSANDIFMINKPLTDSIHRTLDTMRCEGPVVAQPTGKTTFGINNNILYLSVGIVAAAIIIKVVMKKKKNEN